MPIDYSRFDAIVDTDDEEFANIYHPQQQFPVHPAEMVEGTFPALVEGNQANMKLKERLRMLLAEKPELSIAGPKAVYTALREDMKFVATSFQTLRRTLRALLAEGKHLALGTDTGNKQLFSEHGCRKKGFRVGDVFYFGSSMCFLGNAAVPLGEKFEFLPPRPYVLTGRQFAASDAFSRALDHAHDATFLERHALALCRKHNKESLPQGRATVSTTFGISECVLMETHKYVVSALPMSALERCVDLASKIREGLRRGSKASVSHQIVGYVPNTGPDFQDLHCSPSHRVDVMCFLETALNVADTETMIAFSEPDERLIFVHRGFDSTAAVRGANTVEQAVRSVKPTLLRCYWCRKSAACMEEKMKQCKGCKQMDYCSESCQKQDWKAFHRHECASLAGSTKTAIGLKKTRHDDLQKFGGIFPTLQLPLCPCDVGCGAVDFHCNCGSTWNGDSLKAYVCNVNVATMTVGKDTTVFPHGGLTFTPREVVNFQGPQEVLRTQTPTTSSHRGGRKLCNSSKR